MANIKIDARTSELESSVVYKSFDKALEQLSKNDFEVISLSQNAELRIKEGKDSYVSQNGNRVREGVIYRPNENNQILLARNSPLLDLKLASRAVSAHRAGSEYHISEELARQYSNKSSQSPDAEVFHLDNLEPIIVEKFDKDPRARWLFQSQTEAYKELLEEAKIKEMNLYFNDKDYINSQKGPYANQLWLHGLDCGGRSVLDGGGWDLGFDDSVRGVRSTFWRSQRAKF